MEIVGRQNEKSVATVMEIDIGILEDELDAYLDDWVFPLAALDLSWMGGPWWKDLWKRLESLDLRV